MWQFPLHCVATNPELAPEGETMPKLPAQRRADVVVVTVDDSSACMQHVVRAAKEAARRQLPLTLLQDAGSTPLTRLQHAHQLQRLDTAVAAAREAVPGLEVRLADGPLLPQTR